MSDKTKFRPIGVEADINALATKEASDIAGQQSLLKDTVGWTGKNLLWIDRQNSTVNGVTITRNADNSLTLNGTSTAKMWAGIVGGNPTSEGVASVNPILPTGEYILTGCPDNELGLNLTYCIRNANDSGDYINNRDYGDGKQFTINDSVKNNKVRVFIYIPDGVTFTNVTFYPMIRKADITDPTYEPYHESVEVMYEEEIHGVNLLEVTASTQTINGVTFTVNADGSVTANGTATAFAGFTIANHSNKDSFNYEDYIGETLILSGCPANGSISSYKLRYNRVSSDYYDDYGEGLHIVPDANYVNSWFIEIVISSGVTVNNLVFKPMIRKADIEDSTYRPYNHQAIQNQLNAQGVLGAKNLLKNTATSRTVNGVTFTVNSDGSVVLNGTATAEATFNFMPARKELVQGETYIISGCPSDAEFNTYDMARNLAETASGTNVEGMSSTGDVTFSVSNKKWFFAYIRVRSGVTVSNKVFKPMLRLASDPDDTYVPYAMTNRELTEKVSHKVLLEWSNHYAVNDEMILSDSINNYYRLTFALGRNNVENGLQYSDIIIHSQGFGTNDVYICISFFDNNATHRLILQRVSSTKIKIVTSDLTDSNYGIRMIVGDK